MRSARIRCVARSVMPTRSAISRSRMSGVSAMHKSTWAWLVRNVQVFALLGLDIRFQSRVYTVASFVSAEHTGWPSEGPARDYGVALIPDYRDLGRGRSRTSVSSALTPRSFYDRAMPGRVVLLHGASSSGKTTIARAVQRLSDEPWVRLGIDAFWNAIDERWMEHGPRASEGFLWREDATIVPGPVGQGLAAGMRAALAAFARANNDLLVDDVFI